MDKFNRSKEPPKFHITERDIEILKVLNRYRYLKTSQVHRLVFPENTSMQSVRRRLKLLFQNRFVARARPYIRQGDPTPEIIYLLDSKGAKLLIEQGEAVVKRRKAKEVKYAFLNHAIELSDFRIKLEQAVEALPGYSLESFTPDYEMKEFASRYVSKYRYKLYTELTHPSNRRTYTVHPDAKFVLQLKLNGKVVGQRLVFLEIDRGTEGLEKIRDKVTGYLLYQQEQIYKQFGEFNDFLLLIQGHSERRVQNMFDCLVEHPGHDFTRLAAVQDVSPESLLTEKIWRNHNNELRSIVQV